MSILGGTSLSGHFWYYEPALGLWFTHGSGVATPLVTGAQQGVSVAAAHASKPLYWQTTAVAGGVTHLFYGFD